MKATEIKASGKQPVIEKARNSADVARPFWENGANRFNKFPARGKTDGADPARLKACPGASDRFWSKIEKAGPDECWRWTGTLRDGYGRFKLARRDVSAHRIAWALANDRDPGPAVVRHKCDNPPCCNPAHLEIGTVADNNRDKMERGRWRGPDQVGENNGHALLSAAQVGEIIRAFRRHENNTSIAKRYPVTHSLVSRIRTGRSWQREAASHGWEPAIRYLEAPSPHQSGRTGL